MSSSRVLSRCFARPRSDGQESLGGIFATTACALAGSKKRAEKPFVYRVDLHLHCCRCLLQHVYSFFTRRAIFIFHLFFVCTQSIRENEPALRLRFVRAFGAKGNQRRESYNFLLSQFTSRACDFIHRTELIKSLGVSWL